MGDILSSKKGLFLKISLKNIFLRDPKFQLHNYDEWRLITSPQTNSIYTIIILTNLPSDRLDMTLPSASRLLLM